MNLSRNFTLQELIKSDTAVRLGVDNNPNANQIEKLKLLCENILQPVRDHFGPVTITSGFRSPDLCLKIGSSVNSVNTQKQRLVILNVQKKIMLKLQIGFIKI
jgi:zinc D-Ala-D-Ala carboxypeptidase